MTSRPHGLDALGGLSSNWTKVAVAPLDAPQRHSLARVWFGLLQSLEGDRSLDASQISTFADRRTHGFLEAIGRTSGLSALSSTPLFLLALLGLYRLGKSLPTSRLAAVGEIIAQLVEHQPQRREAGALTSRPLGTQPKQRDRVLDDFAFRLQSRQFNNETPDAATVDDAIDGATKLLISRQPDIGQERAEELAGSIFAFAQERAGLLAQKSSSEIGFLHLSFQEYLAARSLIQRPLQERTDFVSANASKLRWREPILYLLHLTSSELEVEGLLAAIRAAPCADEFEAISRDALVVDAVFSDLAHAPSVVGVAEELFSELETGVSGKRETHLLTAVVDGLNSEAVGFRCKSKIAEWLPNRHGWSRGAAIRAMAQWQERMWADCIPVVIRSLYADEDTTVSAAAETLPRISRNHEVRTRLQELAKSASSTRNLASILSAIRSGWSGDTVSRELAECARRSESSEVSLKAILIRADNGETDSADFERFVECFSEDNFRLSDDLKALSEHFAHTNHDEFVKHLKKIVSVADSSRQKLPAILALANYDPGNRAASDQLAWELERDWSLRGVFDENRSLLKNIRWSSEMIASVEKHLETDVDFFRDYEFYHVLKAIKIERAKPYFIASLRSRKGHGFWAAQALVEGWGGADPDVREVLLPFLTADANELAGVAHVLPSVVDDRMLCRSAFLRALRGKIKRVDVLVKGLRQVGVDSDDTEAFDAMMDARSSMRAALWEDQWRAAMIETFPNRPEVREIAQAEIHLRDGGIGAVARSYAEDEAICKQMLDVLAPLPEQGRLSLISNLQQAVAGNPEALELLRAARLDSSGSVAAEATMVVAEVTRGETDAGASDITFLEEELTAVGSIYNERRSAASMALALSGNFGRVMRTLENDTPAQVRLGSATLHGDDRYLRRVYETWPHLLTTMGGPSDVLRILDIEAENSLGVLDPIYPSASDIYKALMVGIEDARHVQDVTLLKTVARFEPGSDRLRELIESRLCRQRDFGNRSEQVAADLLLEHFQDDRELLAKLTDFFKSHPESAIAGALAEIAYATKDEGLADTLAACANDRPHDLVTHLRLVALLSQTDFVFSSIERTFENIQPDRFKYSPLHWPAVLLRRVRDDDDLAQLLVGAISASSEATKTISLAGLLFKAAGMTSQFQEAIKSVMLTEAQKRAPSFGTDIASGYGSSVRGYLAEFGR
jgi:hypothetical protein